MLFSSLLASNVRKLYKKLVDNGNKFGALSTNLSKGFDSVDHNILIAKIIWYWVSPTGLNLIHLYLKSKTIRNSELKD